MTIKYECDVCHGDAKVDDERMLRLTMPNGEESTGMKFDIHLCSQQCKDRLVMCVRNFLAPPDGVEG